MTINKPRLYVIFTSTAYRAPYKLYSSASIYICFFLNWLLCSTTVYILAYTSCQIYQKISNSSQSILYLPVIFHFCCDWLAVKCWLYTIGFDRKLQKTEPISLFVLRDCSTWSWTERRNKAYLYTRIQVWSFSQMFPFQRSASYLTFLVCDFELLDAFGIFCLGEYNNCPKRRFLTWTTMRISDGRTNVMHGSQKLEFLKGLRHE